MDFSGIEMLCGRLTAYLKPSAENGLFIAQCGGELVVGKEIRLLLDTYSQGVIDGDIEALGEFIKPDPSTPGGYTLGNGIVSLHPNEWKSYGVDGKVVEYSPVEAQLKGEQDIGQAE